MPSRLQRLATNPIRVATLSLVCRLIAPQHRRDWKRSSVGRRRVSVGPNGGELARKAETAHRHESGPDFLHAVVCRETVLDRRCPDCTTSATHPQAKPSRRDWPSPATALTGRPLRTCAIMGSGACTNSAVRESATHRPQLKRKEKTAPTSVTCGRQYRRGDSFGATCGTPCRPTTSVTTPQTQDRTWHSVGSRVCRREAFLMPPKRLTA